MRLTVRPWPTIENTRHWRRSRARSGRLRLALGQQRQGERDRDAALEPAPGHHRDHSGRAGAERHEDQDRAPTRPQALADVGAQRDRRRAPDEQQPRPRRRPRTPRSRSSGTARRRGSRRSGARKHPAKREVTAAHAAPAAHVADQQARAHRRDRRRDVERHGQRSSRRRPVPGATSPSRESGVVDLAQRRPAALEPAGRDGPQRGSRLAPSCANSAAASASPAPCAVARW